MSQPGPGFALLLRRQARERGIELQEAQAAALESHCRLLLRWNRAVRLTSITGEAAVRDRHVLESLEALRFLPGGRGRLVDVGSGNGFPALPLLLLRADLEGHLLEPAVRKRAFLKEVIRAAGMADRVRVHADRVDGADDLLRHAPFHCLTARAVGSLAAILAGAAAGLSAAGRAVLFVGEQDAASIGGAPPPGLRVEHVHPLHGRRASYVAVLSRQPAVP